MQKKHFTKIHAYENLLMCINDSYFFNINKILKNSENEKTSYFQNVNVIDNKTNEA